MFWKSDIKENGNKKEHKTILIQEYEHFDSKTDESLTYLYDRFI